MADATKVTQAKPKVAGAVSMADLGTVLPTDATTALAAAFTNLGYITSDGVTNSQSIESSDTKAWGGDVVLSTQTGRTITYKFALMESSNPAVLKLNYGEDNVDGTDPETGIAVKVRSDMLEDHVFVIDMILKDGVLKRIVIPHGTVTATDDISYKDDSAIVYGVTITASPDSEGVTAYEYIKKGKAE